MVQPDQTATISSLRGRLLAALIIPLAALLLISGAVSYGLAQYFADSVYDGWLFDSVSSLAQEVESTPDGPFVDIPTSTQRLFEWDVVDKTFFRIRTTSKGTIAGRPDMPPATGDIDPYRGSFVSDLLADLVSAVGLKQTSARGSALIYDSRLDGQEVRIAALELSAAQFGESVTLEVAETTRKRQRLARAILLSTLIPQLLLIVVAGLAIRRAVTHGLAPLSTIADHLKASSPRELGPILDLGVPDEVRPLTRALNDLLLRLESALAAQRRFIAEAAHQLRTPLTAIKLQVEEVAREQTMEEARPLLRSLRASTDRAVRLSNQLLSLARAEPDGRISKPFARLDLLSLVRETGADWAPRALAADIEMQFGADDDHTPILIDGDEDLLREALNNLLDNAIKYHGNQPGTIELRVVAGSPHAIEVQDSGPGIHADLRARMLQRFTRGERGEGSGLGLSIALEIARLHGGDLLLEDGANGRGLCARLLLPQP